MSRALSANASPIRGIYLLACEQLKVDPRDAVFVGDGANDELGGAERIGMRAVLIHRDDDQRPNSGSAACESPHFPSSSIY